jgi:hypothetical protein
MFHGVGKTKHLMSNRVGVSTLGRGTFHNNFVHHGENRGNRVNSNLEGSISYLEVKEETNKEFHSIHSSMWDSNLLTMK